MTSLAVARISRIVVVATGGHLHNCTVAASHCGVTPTSTITPFCSTCLRWRIQLYASQFESNVANTAVNYWRKNEGKHSGSWRKALLERRKRTGNGRGLLAVSYVHLLKAEYVAYERIPHFKVSVKQRTSCWLVLPQLLGYPDHHALCDCARRATFSPPLCWFQFGHTKSLQAFDWVIFQTRFTQQTILAARNAFCAALKTKTCELAEATGEAKRGYSRTSQDRPQLSQPACCAC